MQKNLQEKKLDPEIVACISNSKLSIPLFTIATDLWKENELLVYDSVQKIQIQRKY